MDKLKLFFRHKSAKYIVAFVLFALFLSVGEYSVFRKIKLENSVEQLREEKKHYEEELQKTRTELESLHKNNENLERIAREKYLMRKPNEDIFIVKEK